MSYYIIEIFYQVKNLSRYRMHTSIGTQTEVIYNNLTQVEVLQFINSHYEFIDVYFHMPKKTYESFHRAVNKTNITCYNLSLTESTKS
jgi:hypothetical protein